jgi:hypothetical protein
MRSGPAGTGHPAALPSARRHTVNVVVAEEACATEDLVLLVRHVAAEHRNGPDPRGLVRLPRSDKSPYEFRDGSFAGNKGTRLVQK